MRSESRTIERNKEFKGTKDHVILKLTVIICALSSLRGRERNLYTLKQ